MSKDVQKIVDGMEKLLEFMALHPKLRDQDARRRVTFNEIFDEIRDKTKELGVNQESVAPFLDHPTVRHMEMEYGMAIDAMGLGVEDYYRDLPLNFRFMPEYQPMLEAEMACVDQKGGVVHDEDLPTLQEIVRQYAPKRGG